MAYMKKILILTLFILSQVSWASIDPDDHDVLGSPIYTTTSYDSTATHHGDRDRSGGGLSGGSSTFDRSLTGVGNVFIPANEDRYLFWSSAYDFNISIFLVRSQNIVRQMMSFPGVSYNEGSFFRAVNTDHPLIDSSLVPKPKHVLVFVVNGDQVTSFGALQMSQAVFNNFIKSSHVRSMSAPQSIGTIYDEDPVGQEDPIAVFGFGDEKFSPDEALDIGKELIDLLKASASCLYREESDCIQFPYMIGTRNTDTGRG